MNIVDTLRGQFKQVKMLQKAFSLVREERVKFESFPDRVENLVEAIKQDYVSQAVDDIVRDCGLLVADRKEFTARLEYYKSQLQECTETVEYYIPSNISIKVSLTSTVLHAISESCSLTEEEALKLFTKYIFIIDQRNEYAAHLKAELQRLGEWYKVSADNDEEDTKQQGWTQDLVTLFNGHTDYIDKLVGLSDSEVACQIKKWCKCTCKENGKQICVNPANNKKSAYTKALKENNLINVSVEWFRHTML